MSPPLLLQVFVLERLQRGDYLSAARCLRLLATSLSPKCVASEAFDFSASLALRLGDLVKAKKLPPTSALWRYAVDNLLVRAVDSHPQVCSIISWHEGCIALISSVLLKIPQCLVVAGEQRDTQTRLVTTAWRSHT